MGTGWTIGEHSIMLSLLKEYNLSISEVARILKRTDNGIKSRMLSVVLEYHIEKKYTLDEIVSKFNFTPDFVKNVIKTKNNYKPPMKEYKTCSEFDEVMNMLEKVKKVQMENGTFDMEAYAKLVDYSMKKYGINIFPK